VLVAAVVFRGRGALRRPGSASTPAFKRQFPIGHPVRVADDMLKAARFSGNEYASCFSSKGAPGRTRCTSRRISVAHRATATFRGGRTQRSAKTLSIVDYLEQMNRAPERRVTRSVRDHSSHPPTSLARYLLLYAMSGNPEDLNSQIDADPSPGRPYACSSAATRPTTASICSHASGAHVAATFPPGLAIRYSGTIASRRAALTETMVHGKVLNMAAELPRSSS